VDDPNAVKVVTAGDGRALYFSRASIPYNRGIATPPRKHLGLYAYRKAALARFAALPPSPLEMTERLEQLRLLENGINIYVEHTTFTTIGVDTEADLLAAEKALQQLAR
jgi:3-deoxy-manno-octulosonate cytidylyltransferase (CMP-KDO synthetase)